MIPQRIKQSTGKTKVTLHELFWMLRTVDTRKVENKISLSTEVVKFFLGISEIILKDFIHLYAFVPTGFAFLYVVKLGAKVSTYKSLGSCY